MELEVKHFWNYLEKILPFFFQRISWLENVFISTFQISILPLNPLIHQLHLIKVLVGHHRALIRLPLFIPQLDLHQYHNAQTNQPRFQSVLNLPSNLLRLRQLLRAESVNMKNLLHLPFQSLMQYLREL